MGLLSEGSPLTWEETKKLSQHVREHGIEQFINLYRRLKNRQGDILKWGDEVHSRSFESLDDAITLGSICILCSGRVYFSQVR